MQSLYCDFFGRQTEEAGIGYWKICAGVTGRLCVRLAQLVRSLTANQEVPGSSPGLVEG